MGTRALRAPVDDDGVATSTLGTTVDDVHVPHPASPLVGRLRPVVTYAPIISSLGKVMVSLATLGNGFLGPSTITSYVTSVTPPRRLA